MGSAGHWRPDGGVYQLDGRERRLFGVDRCWPGAEYQEGGIIYHARWTSCWTGRSHLAGRQPTAGRFHSGHQVMPNNDDLSLARWTTSKAKGVEPSSLFFPNPSGLARLLLAGLHSLFEKATWWCLLFLLQRSPTRAFTLHNR